MFKVYKKIVYPKLRVGLRTLNILVKLGPFKRENATNDGSSV